MKLAASFISRIISIAVAAVAVTALSGLISQHSAYAQNQGAITEQDVGKAIYEARCEACHGPDGKSWENLAIQVPAPPLKGNEFIIAAPDNVIAQVIRTGRTGEKRHYDSTYADMPSFDGTMISDLRPLLAYLKGDMQSGNSK
jgi:mono/diheme cytochrome c family protein